MGLEMPNNECGVESPTDEIVVAMGDASTTLGRGLGTCTVGIVRLVEGTAVAVGVCLWFVAFACSCDPDRLIRVAGIKSKSVSWDCVSLTATGGGGGGSGVGSVSDFITTNGAVSFNGCGVGDGGSVSDLIPMLLLG